MNAKITLILALLFMISCRRNKPDETIAMNNEFVTEFNNEIWKDSLTKRITINGDTAAYNKLYITFNFSGHENDWFYYAFIMAHNFDYPDAYMDLYILLRVDSASNLETNKLANYYLLKAYEKGLEDSKSEIRVRFGNNSVIPSSEDYLKGIK